MKNLDRFIQESKSHLEYDCGDLLYVMTYKNFIKWLDKADKEDSFKVFVIKDMNSVIDDNLNKDQETEVFYNDEESAWWSNNSDDNYGVEDWDIDDNDLILIF